MDKRCPFWEEERECSSQECGIQNCDDEVPIGLKNRRPNRSDEVVIEVFCNSIGKFFGCTRKILVMVLTLATCYL